MALSKSFKASTYTAILLAITHKFLDTINYIRHLYSYILCYEKKVDDQLKCF